MNIGQRSGCSVVRQWNADCANARRFRRSIPISVDLRNLRNLRSIPVNDYDQPDLVLWYDSSGYACHTELKMRDTTHVTREKNILLVSMYSDMTIAVISIIWGVIICGPRSDSSSTLVHSCSRNSGARVQSSLVRGIMGSPPTPGADRCAVCHPARWRCGSVHAPAAAPRCRQSVATLGAGRHPSGQTSSPG